MLSERSEFQSQREICYNGMDNATEDDKAQQRANLYGYCINNFMLMIEVRASNVHYFCRRMRVNQRPW